MRILFEEHQYEATEDIQLTLRDVATLQDVEKKISVGYVGYFYNATLKDCVFILPKVLLKDHEVVDQEGKKMRIEVLADIRPKNDIGRDYITPEDIITKEGQEKLLTDEYRKFIYEFAVWVYRALCVYRKSNPNSRAIYFKELPQNGKGKRHEANTYLDILLSLIRFNQENQNFFMFTIRNIHSGLNKINWTKTISKSQAFIQNGTPIYLNPVNKKRQVNFDEELFVIFFSILNHINKKYGFRAPINFQYELISEHRFEYYLKGYGATRLRQIKYKYFSDKALILWDLCYAFFDSAHLLAVNTDQREYLLAKKFEVVFEAMIDNLIGDDKIPRGLKEQDDGKRVDHMYTFDALTRDDAEKTDEQIYYIGDSKYYKSGNALGRQSIYKQYTYARNVIQWNINLFLSDEVATKDMSEDERKDYNADRTEYEKINLRKDGDKGIVTEGYNVIPNFFLSAFVYPDRRYVAKENIVGHRYKNAAAENKDEEGYVVDNQGRYRPQTHISYQFENRLFDRDTLILSHYDVNFLYVIYLYARQRSSEKAAWRGKVRNLFRDEIRKVLSEQFEFYILQPMADGKAAEYIERNFHKMMGKIYRMETNDSSETLLLALEKQEHKGNDLRDELESHFYIAPYMLGDVPKASLEKRYDVNFMAQTTANVQLAKTEDEEVVLVGVVKNNEHWNWILGGFYNIRLMGSEERTGALMKTKEMMMVSKVLLYRVDDTKGPIYLGLFDLKDPDSVPNEYKLAVENPHATMDYPISSNPDQNYLVYEIDTDDWKEPLQNASLAAWLKELWEKEKGAPKFIKSGDLKKIIRPDEKPESPKR